MKEFNVWKCVICGWLYDEAKGCPDDDIAPGTRWEDIPEDWYCPECGVGKEDFEMVQVTHRKSKFEEKAPSAEVNPPGVDHSQPPIVILGAGLAGYNLAMEVRKQDSVVPILMITADDGAYYSKPLLSIGFQKQQTAEHIVIASAEEMSKKHAIQVHIYSRVDAVDVESKQLSVNGHVFDYGKLVFAVGSECLRAPVKGNGVKHIYSVNDLMDYRRFRTVMAGVKKVLIIGCGLIGCEYANDLSAAGYEVETVDPVSHPLGKLLPVEAATSLQKALGESGVKFHFNCVVDSVNHCPGEGVIATLDNGREITADIVLMAIGVIPRIDLAKQAGILTNRGIVIDRQLQTSAPDVYALGDCTEIEGHVLPYVAPLLESARILAKNLTGQSQSVCFGAMPVTVKTTLFPVVINPPKPELKGEWIIEQQSQRGVRAVFKDTQNNLLGFALTGDCVKDKDSLAKLSPSVMNG